MIFPKNFYIINYKIKKGTKKMYRQYENPVRLEKELVELKKEYNDVFAAAEAKGPLAAEWEYLCDLAETIEELKERINFAWQDDEADSLY